jgi:peptide/nickel transport system substrate-binding protein
MTGCYPDPDGPAEELVFNPDNASGADGRYLRAWQAGWFNPAANALVESGKLEADSAARRTIYQQLQLLARRSPVIILFQGEFSVAARRNVRNLGLHGYGTTFGTVVKQ